MAKTGTNGRDVEFLGLFKDSFDALGGADEIHGEQGDDALNGGSGDDLLLGEEGSDFLFGDAGNDELNGGAERDRMDGGTGNDRYILTIDLDNVVEQLNQGEDRISTTLNGITLPKNVERLQLLGSANLNGNGNTLNNELTGNGGINVLRGEAGDDRIYGADPTQPAERSLDQGDRLYGDSGDDLLKGDGGDDLLKGGADDDVLRGGSGNDTLNGEAGADQLYGEEGNDSLNGGNDNDRLKGGNGNDSLNGEGGNDTLNGEADQDTLNGGEGDDTLLGGAGNDTLNGGNGTNLLQGEAGNDTLDGRQGSNTLEGGSDHDIYLLAAANPNQTIVEAANGGIDTIQTGDTFSLGNFQTIENLTLLAGSGTATTNGNGNALANVIIGNNNANLLKGEAGDDLLFGGFAASINGNDTLQGGNGNDVLIGGGGNDILTGGAGNDLFLRQTIAPANAIDQAGRLLQSLGLDTVNLDQGQDTFVYQPQGNGGANLGFVVNQFDRGAGGDFMAFQAVTAVDVVQVGNNTEFRVGNGIANDAGFGTGQLLVTLNNTIGFSSDNIGLNVSPLNQAQFSFG